MNSSMTKRIVFLLTTTALTLGFSVQPGNAENLRSKSESSAMQKTTALQTISSDLPTLSDLTAENPNAAGAQALLPDNTQPSPLFLAQSSQGSVITQSGDVMGQELAPTTPSSRTSPSEPATLPDGTYAQPTAPAPTAPETVTPGATTDPYFTTSPDSGLSQTPTPETTTPGTTTDPYSTPSDSGLSQTPTEPAPSPVQGFSPGRATRSGPSYIGVGGNIGIGEGDTALGEGSFAVFSKIGLTRYLSVRPAVLFSDDPTILLPVTFDFIPGVTRVTEDVSEDLGLRISPFIGPGIAISTGDDSAVDFLLSAGVDVPITRRLTATASVNASFFDNVAVGLLLGIGINF